MKKIALVVCVLLPLVIQAKVSTVKDDEEKTRKYINPFSAVMEYVAFAENSRPTQLMLPASWDYAPGKRCVSIGDNIVCIRRTPPRSAWKPSF